MLPQFCYIGQFLDLSTSLPLVIHGIMSRSRLPTCSISWSALRRRIAVLSTRAKDVYVQSIASLLQALDEKDRYTARHAVNVAFYAKQIAEQMKLSKAAIKSVHNAALLHDIGKVGVPDKILMKRSVLTPLERMVID